ncbi:cAMP-binding domain of CRP or a regulatory subunit of cAMP-dependent protein kinases [Pseudarcicella hirudinis]|uniref:cAMP-binding domain of CRP or a regulatory subunit of cAMP-dependent protein kinases n=1 Tax=Pseudarcicella hirudinis TaxID=1079859 RepID=A0A1I5MA65_9BACT|nr:Crp/Fnr family transcriptional regulator [Pseudarcicella hirudinis]SFP06435.1 cAMP-binding domain of CRP or a regulatory subunit of cAMP-dependent protein kinases [Pseudarcicella hirudinis]
MIPAEILEQFGASQKVLKKGEILFQETEEARFYYQIITGEVKMLNWNSEGKEFIQGIFTDGQSFGEPALFGRFPYPASVIASRQTLLYKLSFDQLMELLKYNFEIHLSFTEILSRRLQYKAMIMKEISNHDAEHQITTLMKYLKRQAAVKGPFEVKLTRQNIADMTGLRVETVIRTIKAMVQQHKLIMKDRKVYLP